MDRYSANTLDTREFITDHVVWSLIVYMWYRLIFRCVGDLSPTASRIILFGIIAAVAFAFGVVEFRKNRNNISLFINLASGYGIYTVITYIQIKTSLIKATVIVAAILSLLSIALIMLRRIKNKKRIQRIMLRRARNSIITVQRIFGLAMLIIVTTLWIPCFFGGNVLYSNATHLNQPKIEGQSLKANIETVALLEQNHWEKLSVQEKLDVLGVVADIEKRYLGLPHELVVGAADLKEGTLAQYSDSIHQVSIDLNHLIYDGSEDVLDSLLHEAYHAYQHRCWDAYMSIDERYKPLRLFNKAVKCGNEFVNYDDGDEDFFDYYMQDCEGDARDYAESAAEDYYNKINEYYGYEAIGVNADSQDSYQVSYRVQYEDDGFAYLIDNKNEKIAGPYLSIEDDLNWVWNKACRYTGMNGLIGYLDTSGNEITPPMFIEDSKMNNGNAMVSEQEGRIYYINDSGEKITEEYKDGFPFETEHGELSIGRMN